ncbi:DUF6492 family protein [Pararoseomonas indoligenes]|uniref:Uncharacterized protein n=1 Tax=Roseomonas indoligenes TaxID=2820811 RepID=A0A940MWX8_9PROT|nr:DUF6492 family protein [Pararoseomonas indoligenes]MBP0493596.1 hypothetical protein [Pararoseomonas indoligenes]
MERAEAPFVAMLTLSARHNDIERARILLASLERFLREPITLFIVAPDSAMETVRAAHAGSGGGKVALQFMPDSAVLAESVAGDATVRGTVRQMLVKMGFARHCPAPFYLTLDADVALIREWGVADAMPDGRAGVQRKAVREGDTWCSAAAELLGTPFDYPETMDVTPALISAEGMRDLLEALEARHGDWQRALADRHAGGLKWTEYTLYWHHLRDAGLLEKLHAIPEGYRIFVMRSLWRAPQIEGWSLDLALKGRGGFVVLQSSTGLAPEAARAMLGMDGPGSGG